MKKLMVAAVVALFGAGAFADTFYVDAVNGHDDWTGGADYEHRDETVTPVKGPKRTLQTAVDLMTATTKESQTGDTLYIAEGDYTNGMNSAGTARASLPKGGQLVGVGDRDRIRIFGGATNGEWTAESTFRCLSVSDWSVVRNVTLCNGRATGTTGGCCTGSGTFLDCVFTNNYCATGGGSGSAGRGGTLNSGTAIRCLFIRNNSDGYGASMLNGKAFNCVFKGAGGSSDTYNTTTYNCTFVGSCTEAARGYSHYNALFTKKWGSSISFYNCVHIGPYSNRTPTLIDEDCVLTNDTGVAVEADYSPKKGTVAIDRAKASYYDDAFPAKFADEKDLDCYRNLRVRGKGMDCGAVEYDPSAEIKKALSSRDELSLVSVSAGAYAEDGAARLTDGQSVSAAWATASGRYYANENAFSASVTGGGTLTVRVYTNGVAAAFWSLTETDGPVTIGYLAGDHTIAFAFEGAGSAGVSSLTTDDCMVYFVSKGGNDENDGLTPETAKLTLAAAMEIEGLAAGSVVHVMRGVYDDKTNGSYRVNVPEGVGLVADEGPALTVIEGRSSTDETADKYGNGPGAIRGVYLNASAYVSGFTIRNCRTRTGSNNVGGGVYGDSSAAAIGCVITNNATNYRGGGIASVKCIRCYLKGNVTTAGTGSQGNNGSFIGCVIDDGACYTSTTVPAINSTFVNGGVISGNGSVTLYNCVYTGTSGGSNTGTQTLINCVAGGLHSKAVPGEGTFITNGLASQLDADYRPISGSCLIDNERAYVYYTNRFPAAWRDFMWTDYAGGQRVYNGRLDLGAGEYDWRGAFAKTLAKRGVAVEVASAGVTTNEVAGMDLADGETLTVKCTLKTDGEVSFKVVPDGEGTVKVMLGETRLTPVENTYTFDGAVGETVVTITYVGDGKATVSGFALPGPGLILLLR